MHIQTELDNFLGERQRLIEAIADEFRSGTSASAIAATVAPAFSRDVVKQYLAAVDRSDKARKALNEAGLGRLVDVRVSGIDAPRQALIGLAVDPSETEDYQTLPQRLRHALAPFLLTVDLPSGEAPDTGASIDDAIDTLLLEGERAQIVRIKART